MPPSIQDYILQRLKQRNDEDNFRSLKLFKGYIDFTSNDYLGFAADKELARRIQEEIKNHADALTGSTGSRLLSGNSSYAELLEKELAAFHHAEAALVFNTGFVANYGLLSTLPYKGDTIIYDELVHASIHDGIRASKAINTMFRHNDLADLEQKLQTASGLKYVVVESVYSMDGDFAPLAEIAGLCTTYNAGLIVDEAHANGILGKDGSGLVCQLGLEDKCLARIYTFGKALGGHGGAILCSEDLKMFLINYCRPFIYSTALPFHAIAAVRCAYRYLPLVEDRRKKLFELIATFKSALKPDSSFRLIESNSPIQSVVVAGNTNIKQFATNLQQQGFDVRPILYPTVAKGAERIRICLHSFNTAEEVLKLAEAINKL